MLLIDMKFKERFLHSCPELQTQDSLLGEGIAQLFQVAPVNSGQLISNTDQTILQSKL